MIDIYVTVAEDGQIENIFAYSQGIGYKPVQATRVYEVDKFSFDIPVKPDTTPALGVGVVDSVGVGDKVGG